MMTDPVYHEPVLCNEAVSFLLTDDRKTYVDGTVGGGGHAEEICARLQGEGKLICFDADEDAIRVSRERLVRFGGRVAFVHANYSDLRTGLQSVGVARIAGLILDLGVSSHQLDEGSKGFSFRSDDPLDMRLDRRAGPSAREVVNSYTESQLAQLLHVFGEEKAARAIARRIVRQRPLETTGELKKVVASVTGERFLTKSLARVFQAIRIEVNRELDHLRAVLPAAVDLLEPNGRIVVIAYHSLEDRIVKDFFRQASLRMIPSGHKYIPDREQRPTLRVLTKKPVEASAAEQRRNPRARSAKMRVAERCADAVSVSAR